MFVDKIQSLRSKCTCIVHIAMLYHKSTGCYFLLCLVVRIVGVLVSGCICCRVACIGGSGKMGGRKAVAEEGGDPSH